MPENVEKDLDKLVGSLDESLTETVVIKEEIKKELPSDKEPIAKVNKSKESSKVVKKKEEINLVPILRSIIKDKDIVKKSWKGKGKSYILKLSFNSSTCFIHSIIPSMFADDNKEFASKLIEKISFDWLMEGTDLNINLINYIVKGSLSFCPDEVQEYFIKNGYRIAWDKFIKACKILSDSDIKRIGAHGDKREATYFRETFRKPLELYTLRFSIKNVEKDFPYVSKYYGHINKELIDQDDIDVYTFGYIIKINEIIKLIGNPKIIKPYDKTRGKKKNTKRSNKAINDFKLPPNNNSIGNIADVFDGIKFD